MRIPFMKQVAWYLVFAMFAIALVPKVEAGFSPSELMRLQDADRGADLAKIQKVLETKVIKDRLEVLGFSQDEIQNRLSGLSDQKLHELSLKIDDLKVGGDGLGIVIALLVIAILVVLLIQLTGHRVVVTK